MEWQKIFNIHSNSLDKLKEWQSKDPARSKYSLLYLALEHGLLSMEAYLKWAKQKHRMPLIKERFFFEQEPDWKVWQEIKKQLPWSMEILPLFQWKGQLFVVCLEKPVEEWNQAIRNMGFHAQFILGSIQGIKIWHKKLFSQPKSPDNYLGESSEPSSAVPKISVAEAKEGLYKEVDYDNAEIKETFIEMEKSFESCMILRLKENELSLRPWLWNSYCQQMRGEQKMEEECIDLSQRSIFRIVYRSQQPYHGYIVPSPINQQFFNQWNGRKVPQHITICPILINKTTHIDFRGMLLGFNTEHNITENEKCLFLVQKRAKMLAKNLDSLDFLSKK